MHFNSTIIAKASRRGHGLGFTLLEALVVLALMGILVALAAPALSDLRVRHQLQAQAEALLDSMVLARSQALMRQQRVTLCALASDQSCDAQGQWQQGWMVFVDTNHNAQRDLGEDVLQVHAALPQPQRVSATQTVMGYYSYGADGRSQSNAGAFMAGTWRFCQATVPVGWQVVSNALGRPRVEKYVPPECP
jgi:type IV fimbrial biogenesis protein FimT